MSARELFLQARAINDKFTKSEDDWKEVVRLYVAAGEQATGLTNIEIADCFKWSATIMLNEFTDKSPETYNEALRLYQKVESVKYLPNWYAVVDENLVARIAPHLFGFDPCKIDAGDPDLIDSMVDKLVRLKSTLEAVASVPDLLGRSIFVPVYTGRARSFAENKMAIRAIDRLLNAVWKDLSYYPMGEVGFTARGLLFQYCMPKTLDSFEKAVDSHCKAIDKLTLIENGAVVAYVHLIDLLERPAVHGFGDIPEALTYAEKARDVRDMREEWYKTDPSRRLMLWEARMIVDADWPVGTFWLWNPPAESLQRAIKLGEAVLAESDNNLFKMEAAALLGWIHQQRMLRTPENFQKAVAYYAQVFQFDPVADGSIQTDFTFCNVSREDRIRGCTQIADRTARKALQLILPVCFSPEKYAFPVQLRSDLDGLMKFLTSRKKGDPHGELVQRCVGEYTDFLTRVEAMLAQANLKMGKDAFLLSSAEGVGRAILEHAGTSDGAEVVKKKEQELLSHVEIVESFYGDDAMAMFYQGFTLTFSQVYIASMAVRSGTVSISTDNLAVSAALMVLSMLPLIGGIAPALVDVGYSAYVEEKVQSSAYYMAATFRLEAMMTDAVLKALREVHRQRLPEITELEGNSGKIVTGLFAQLQGKLEDLRGLIAKQPDQGDLEKLAAQVAMDIIQREIYSGRLKEPEPGRKLVTPQQVADRLVAATLKAVAELHAKQDVHMQRAATASAKVLSNPPSTRSPAADVPAPRTAAPRPASDNPAKFGAVEVESDSRRLLAEPPSRGCPCSIM